MELNKPAKSGNLAAYAGKRLALIEQITRVLSADPRFAAAWLVGSFGRGEADDVSDLDLVVAVNPPHEQKLCDRPWMTSGKTTAERLALVSRFGEPVMIHENNNNAPEDGSFTFVLYTPSALMVDWILVPVGAAQRPAQSMLLFDKAGIPLLPEGPSEDLPKRLEIAAERMAFFWMMAAVTLKYMIRHDSVAVLELLDRLYAVVGETEQVVAGESWEYQQGSLAPPAVSEVDQMLEIQRLIKRMERVTVDIRRSGGQVVSPPTETLSVLMEMIS